MSAASAASRIHCPIDFGRQGRQAGYLRAPHSRDNSGWGTIEIPIYCLANGEGPTVLLTGGVHGDEYEGQIAISRLAQTLDVDRIQGRIIMMPAVNIPAVLADRRLSPIDGLDINRCFPGDARGTFTRMLAHFMDSVVLPHADVSVDLHTTGHSADCALSTNMHDLPDAAMRDKTLAAAAAFGAPYNVVFAGVDEGATFTSCVERRGIVSLGTELGGWGRVNIEGVRIAARGIDNILKHFGVIEGEPDLAQADGTFGTRHMMVRERDAFHFAPRDGLFEPTHYAGETVEEGAVAGYLHVIEDVDTPPIAITYARSGVIWCGAGPGRVRRGDAVCVVMEDFAPDRPAH
ncbi:MULTISPECIES: succinylglutamate desuccinylase/aspartoacylase family protein [unclassified Roseitalea]|uniref:succinylglutamate desuccinylase/aspartoacylase family protein n=1 Tax=unclassified Roseitalea TaxID=2639107 RepID=UPI0027401395|nr:MULTISPECIES: succinylglutamate desuccinylase/aspartoacylase family protein [unclassified Roseitalea]